MRKERMKTRVIQDDSEPDENGINRAAPVLGASETEIAADPVVVWDVLSGIRRWPEWNPDVKSVSMSGPVSAGSEFRWKAGPGTITSTLEHVEPPCRIAWSGKAFGLRALHVYALESRNGRTLVRTEESYDGLMALVFRSRLKKTLECALESGLRHLKAEAERRSTHIASERRS
jgi:uncharacterized protein YndB with AHSA1/START domain